MSLRRLRDQFAKAYYAIAGTPANGQGPRWLASRNSGNGGLAFEQLLSWLGAWSNATAYVVGDVVILSSTPYVCILGHTNHTPPNATYWTALGASGASIARTTVAIAPGSLANNASHAGSISAPKSGEIIYLDATHFHWLRLYSTAAGQAADSSRPLGTLLTEAQRVACGLLAERDGTVALSDPCSPNRPHFHNLDGTPASTLYYQVWNKSGGTATLTITLTILPIEV